MNITVERVRNMDAVEHDGNRSYLRIESVDVKGGLIVFTLISESLIGSNGNITALLCGNAIVFPDSVSKYDPRD